MSEDAGKYDTSQAFKAALRTVIEERDAWRIAGKFAVESFTAYLEHGTTETVRFYRPDAERAVEELRTVLKLSEKKS